MADTTMLAFENLIVDGFLDHIDWRDEGVPPHAVTVGERREGHPRHFVATATYPLVCVRVLGRMPMDDVGHQRRVVTSVRVATVIQMDTGVEIDTVLRQETGKIVENILESDRLGMDWVTQVQWPKIDYESDFERWLRSNADPSGGVLTASEADFPVDAYYVTD